MRKINKSTQTESYQKIVRMALALAAGVVFTQSAQAAANVSFRIGLPQVDVSLNPDSSLFPSVSLENDAKVGEYMAVDVGVIGFNFSLFNLDTTLNDVRVQGGLFDTSAIFDDIESATASGTGVIIGYGTQIELNPLYLKLGAGVGGGNFSLDLQSDSEDFSESQTLVVWELRGGVGFKLTDNFGLSADYRYMRAPDIGVTLDGQQGDAGFNTSIFTAGVDFSF